MSLVVPRPYKMLRYMGDGKWEIYGSCQTLEYARARVERAKLNQPGQEFRIMLET